MFKKTRKISLINLTKAMVMTAVLGGNAFAYAAVDSNALPTGEHNKRGIDSIDRLGPSADTNNRAVMNIKQNANVSVANIDWNSFNIGSNATLNVKQMNTNHTLVNTVVGNNMSEIYGHINATGNIVLINPKGAVFGGDAQINVGGLSVYAAAGTANGSNFTPDANQKLQGKITVEGNAKINVGPGYALYAMEQMKNLGITDFDKSNFVMGVPNYDANVGKLRLVAAGDVEIKKGTMETESGTVTVAPRLVAIGHLSDDGTRTVGEEEFIVGGQGSGSGNAIIIRSDVDVDDYGTVKIDPFDENECAVNITGAGNLDVYYNPDIVDQATTGDANPVLYNKQDYKNEKIFTLGTVTFDTTVGSDDDYGVNQGKWHGTADQTVAQIEDAGGIEPLEEKDIPKISGVKGYMLVNNIAQLQDIEDPT